VSVSPTSVCEKLKVDYDGGVDLLLVNNSQLVIFYSKVKITQANEFCSEKLTALPYDFGNPQYTSVVQLTGDLTVSSVQQVVHLADINSDGYPDLLIQLQLPGQPTYPYFLYNEPSDQSGSVEFRTFKSPYKLSQNPSLMVGFFDLLENG